MQKLDKLIFTTLFFSIFATITGVGIVVPLLPVYAHDLGAGGLYIGLIFGAFSLSRVFFLPYFGKGFFGDGRQITSVGPAGGEPSHPLDHPVFMDKRPLAAK